MGCGTSSSVAIANNSDFRRNPIPYERIAQDQDVHGPTKFRATPDNGNIDETDAKRTELTANRQMGKSEWSYNGEPDEKRTEPAVNGLTVQMDGTAIISLPGGSLQESIRTPRGIKLETDKDETIQHIRTPRSVRREAHKDEPTQHKLHKDGMQMIHADKAGPPPQKRMSELETLVTRLVQSYAHDRFPSTSINKWYMRVMLTKTSATGRTSSHLGKGEDRMKELIKCRQEKSRLLTRLSEIASTRLRANNPDIADLSDPNRATKLSDKLSELYDNEWTDAFEEIKAIQIKNTDEKVIILFLRDILKYCDAQCREMALQQRKRLFQLLNLSSKTDDQFDTCSPDMRLRLKEFQKLISPRSITHVQKSVSQNVVGKSNHLMWVQFGQGVRNVQDLIQVESKLAQYMNVCVEATWYMQIQDPPTALLFSNSDILEPSTYFRAYTVSGSKLDYVLWPAMLLYEHGPRVSKGVAQFIKDIGDKGFT